MKKHVLLLLFLAFSSIGSLAAQENNFSLGLAFNPNLGWISADDLNINDDIDVSSSGARMGFSYGLLFEYHFSDNYHIASGVHHVFSGGRFSGLNNEPDLSSLDEDGQKVYSNVSYQPVGLRYIHLPILVRLKTNEIGYISYFGNIGFGFDFGLNGQTDIKLEGHEFMADEADQIQEFEEEFQDVRYKTPFLNNFFIVGLGGQYSLGGNTKIHLGLDYNVGLSDVVSRSENSKYGNVFNDSRFNNSYVSLNLGIYL